MNEYEMQRMETMIRNSRVFRSLGIQEATDILKKSRAKVTDAIREDSGSLYQPGDCEDIEQGEFDKVCEQSIICVKYADSYSFVICCIIFEAMQDLEPEVTMSSARVTGTKRVMAVALQKQDQPARITRQRTRELVSAREDTTDPQDGFSEDGLMAANANT